MRSGWRAKAIHRLILTSDTYRRASLLAENRSSAAAATARDADPNNELLWRAERKRLTAEQVRDAILAASGELNERLGGASVRPELPEGISAAYAWKPTEDASERNRRSIYLFVRRNLREPLLDTLDVPDSHESCARRLTTTTAPQALVLLNGRWTLDRSRALAARVLADVARTASADARDATGRESRWIRRAFSIALLREPDLDEQAAAEKFVSQQARLVAARLARGESIARPTSGAESVDPAAAAALVDFCHVLLNSNEFVYLD
jgi:hypothetical protein